MQFVSANKPVFLTIVELYIYVTFYRTQVNLGSDLWVRMSQTNKLTPRPCVDLTDVTLADEDTNSILTDNVNRAIQGNVAMQVTQPNFQPMLASYELL